jgi:hypothetical protein
VSLAEGVVQQLATEIAVVAMRAGKIHLPHARVKNILAAFEVAAVLRV